MNVHHTIVPYGLIVIGVIYIAKPDIFYRFLERQKAAGEATKLPRQNLIFMRVLGIVFILLGSAMLFYSHLK